MKRPSQGTEPLGTGPLGTGPLATGASVDKKLGRIVAESPLLFCGILKGIYVEGLGRCPSG